MRKSGYHVGKIKMSFQMRGVKVSAANAADIKG